MEKIYLLVVFLFLKTSAQKIEFEPTIKISYDASLNLGERNQHFQKFVLIGNSQDYYFAAAQNYLNDTGQYKAKANVDTQTVSDYFQERLIRKNGTISIFF